MKNNFFQWDIFAKSKEIDFPYDTIEELFLLDLEERNIWLSKKLACLVFPEAEDMRTQLSFAELQGYFVDGGINVLIQEIDRLIDGKINRVNSHVSLKRNDTSLSSVCYVFKLPTPRYLLGFLSIDYEPVLEYEQEIKKTIDEMQHVKAVNELILEGAADYIYQWDVAKNTCVFSPKVMELLPIESTTVTDAMSKMLSFIIPEDRKEFLDSLTQFLSGKSDYHRVKYRVLSRRGELIWIYTQGKVMRDEAGKPVMLAGSMADITEQQKKQEEIHQMLYYDELTKLKNRRCFETEMEEYLQTPGVRGAFVAINISKFKMFNEMFGRHFADKVLQVFAEKLSLYFPDARGIYHLTADEFVVHLPDYEREAISRRMMPFVGSMKSRWEVDRHSFYVNVYASVAMYPENGTNLEDLNREMMKCLSGLSREDKTEIRFISEQPGENLSRQYMIETALRKDIENNFEHFRVVYQPIVHIDEKGVAWGGAEALLRYNNPDMPEIGQMDMIHTLEYSGMILPVGRWVLEQAVKECYKWNKEGPRKVVHVNMAAQQVTDNGLVEYIKDLCANEKLPYSSLVVELTETSLVNNYAMAIQLCQELRKIGIGVALDDFGTGYSGFSYLRNFPISQIKIDREYARDISKNHYNQVIVAFIQNLSKYMGLELCVEGVETEDELNVLVELGVNVIQGFYFERPMEAEMIRKEFIKMAVGDGENK